MKRWGWYLLIAAAPATPVPAYSAEEVADYFTRDWYVTEVIVFQRPAVMEYNTRERLLINVPEAYPLLMRSPFAPPEQIGAGYRLDAATFTALEPEFITTERPTTFAIPDPEAPPTPPSGDPEPEAPLGGPAPAIEPVLEPHPLLDFLAAVAAYEATLLAQSFRWAPEQEHTLQRAAAALGGQFNFQVLLHQRWIQPVPPRDAAAPVYVQAGPQFGATHLLEGTLGVTLGRYLHFKAQLIYREPGFGQAPISLVHPVQGLLPAPALPDPAPGYMVLAESRRMRSEEVHYLDHPKLGIIVRIDPVPIPEPLALSFQALQESDE